MKLIFERSTPEHGTKYLPDIDVPKAKLPKEHLRGSNPKLPEISEPDLCRHYKALSNEVFGVSDGFYPLGSCTMKYNPRLNERIAGLSGFTAIHPLQPNDTVKGCAELLTTTGDLLCEITGMDAFTFQPAAGAHGEFTGLLIIKKHLEQIGQKHRKKMLVPDSAHGTNPASAAMAGFETVHIPSDENGCIDVDTLKELLSDDIAGLMLTNPNTVGLLDPNILKITSLVHEHGGLCYYDGANLNAVLGHARPGDIGFDVMHLNLHKTFSTPHGGGGPGSGPVGCKAFLKDYLPGCALKNSVSAKSIGQVRSYFGNFLVVVRALAYILTLGKEGLSEVSEMAVLNANYLMHLIKDEYTPAYDHPCMHEFVVTLSKEKKQYGVTALDAAKALLDRGMHPPTMYFPLIVDEALMIEPTETESKRTLEEAAEAFREVYRLIKEDPEQLHNSPSNTIISRPDETNAARHPVLRYKFDGE